MHVGEVHYIRNGHHISTLMHVDTTLPLWALFDIYGAVQKVKLLGKVFSFLFMAFVVGGHCCFCRFFFSYYMDSTYCFCLTSSLPMKKLFRHHITCHLCARQDYLIT